jgi:hypothetical protein
MDEEEENEDEEEELEDNLLMTKNKNLFNYQKAHFINII